MGLYKERNSYDLMKLYSYSSISKDVVFIVYRV